ncbi:DUF3817 domain-containing protein [Parapedobacter sp. 10938]|uniref:DUF3817 domain-containing protein n=1 Tax=Parapedobacter flavus TaxID=3110225 RepID=UPI002DBC2AAD|nr:DUF3817 domain-containing protein [Parapedobacter sp. 10938]MEC3881430.1 DUF3817 domain-containing protein [Parapedobacter sp. 10938]
MHTTKKTLVYFRNVAIIEGISTIILFFVAMPLKYFAGMPLAVTYVGWAHGVLFVAYAGLLVLCWTTYKWKFKRVAVYFIASLIPFAPFVVEKRLRHEG